MMNDDQSGTTVGSPSPLTSWKEIGAYLQRDARTARRWEKEEGLPVHRHSHKSRASVYAYPGEIDAWRVSRKVVAEQPVRSLWRWPAFAVTMLLCVMMVGNGLRPQIASAQQQPKAARQIWVTRPSEDPAYNSISPDGRYLTFTDWETGDLSVHDLTTRANRRITSNAGPDAAYSQNAVFSPDGQQIAYNWTMEKDLRNELRIVPLAGGNPRSLWRSEGNNDYLLPQSWSPDGRRLLAVHVLPDRTSQITLLTVQDGAMRALKSFGWQNLNASFSPDGRWIAYDSQADATTPARDIFVMAADGSREAAAVRNPANDAEPVWSPDGSRILFLSDRTGQESLWSVPLVNGKPGPAEMVKADIGRVERIWMTRGGTLYYLIPGGANTNIYTAELAGDMKASHPPALAVETFVTSNNGPSLSPDGQYLAYESFRPGSAGITLVIQTIKTKEERVISTKVLVGMIRGIGPMWFPDGRSVLVMSRLPQGPGINLYRIELASGNAEMLLRTAGVVQGYKLSPDGKFIVYTALDSEGSDGRLLRFDIETRRETELKKGEQFVAVAVSPDNQQLAYVVSKNPESYIAVMPSGGGELRELFRASPWFDGSRYNTLAWTQDQHHLLFVRGSRGGNGSNVLWRVPVSGGPPEQMGLSMPGASTIKSPQIHPDGRHIYFAANENGPNEVWALENFLPATNAKR